MVKKSKAGRKTVMTKYVLRKLEEAYLMGCTDEEACFSADISTSALYDYQKKNPEFLERKRRFSSRPVFIARQTIIAGIEKDPNLALKYLERKAAKEFSLKHMVVHKKPEQGAMTDEQKARVEEILSANSK